MSSSPSLIEMQDSVRSADRMITAMRLILALSALVVIYLYPSEPDRYAAIVYSLLAIYTLYSAALCLLAILKNRGARVVRRWTHWMDVGWYTLLVALSSGTNSFFFFGYFFAVLVASFRWGIHEGFAVTTVSFISFNIVSLIARPYGVELEFNRFLLRSISFLLLGYMLAYWGNSEIALRRKLELLKEVSKLSNLRFGIDRTIGLMMESLQSFYDANTCLLVMANRPTAAFTLRRTDGPLGTGVRGEPLGAELAQKMLMFPPDYAVVYHCRQRWLERLFSDYCITGNTTARLASGDLKTCEALAVVLDTRAFLTVPLNYHRTVEGRLFLCSQHRFTLTDLQFLLQVTSQLLPVLANIRLVDRMATEAAEAERQRIALDIHDNVIQPYLGLQLGLASVQRKLAAGSASALKELERLSELTSLGIADLRSYVSSLKDGGTRYGNLASAIKRFAAKFTDATQIEVMVDAEAVSTIDGQIPDRLGAEVFQLIVEGLNNVRRHTQATRATVSLSCQGGHLIVKIGNQIEQTTMPRSFTPHSIAERAATLGGLVQVEQNKEQGTVVCIDIPL